MSMLSKDLGFQIVAKINKFINWKLKVSSLKVRFIDPTVDTKFRLLFLNSKSNPWQIRFTFCEHVSIIRKYDLLVVSLNRPKLNLESNCCNINNKMFLCQT